MRNRNLSTFEYFNTAVSIRNEVTRLVTSGAVPKSYRFIFRPHGGDGAAWCSTS